MSNTELIQKSLKRYNIKKYDIEKITKLLELVNQKESNNEEYINRIVDRYLTYELKNNTIDFLNELIEQNIETKDYSFNVKQINILLNLFSKLNYSPSDDLINSLETFYGYLGVKENEYFYKRFLGEKIYVIEEDKYEEILEKDEYKSMKIGDVKIIDNIIVIKISDEDI